MRIIVWLIVFVFWEQIASAQTDEELQIFTPLDRAMYEAEADHSKRGTYYEVLLASELYLFAEKTPAKEKDVITPLMLEVGEYKGTKVVYVFDTKQRAMLFAKTGSFQSISIMKVKAEGVFNLMADEYFVYLNPKTHWQKFFNPEEVRFVGWDRKTPFEMSGQVDAYRDMKAAQIPEGQFSSSLLEASRKIQEIQEIYVFVHPEEPYSNTDLPNYVLVVRVKNSDIGSQLATEINTILRKETNEYGFVDMMFVTRKELKKLVGQEDKPFFKRDSK